MNYFLYFIHPYLSLLQVMIWFETYFQKYFCPDELVKSRSPTRSEKPGLPPEAKTISKEFADYLGSRVRKSGMADLSRNKVVKNTIRTDEIYYIHVRHLETVSKLQDNRVNGCTVVYQCTNKYVFWTKSNIEYYLKRSMEFSIL